MRPGLTACFSAFFEILFHTKKVRCRSGNKIRSFTITVVEFNYFYLVLHFWSSRLWWGFPQEIEVSWRAMTFEAGCGWEEPIGKMLPKIPRMFFQLAHQNMTKSRQIVWCFHSPSWNVNQEVGCIKREKMKDKAKVYENIGVPIALLVLKESITLLNTYSHSEKTGIIK